MLNFECFIAFSLSARTTRVESRTQQQGGRPQSATRKKMNAFTMEMQKKRGLPHPVTVA
jgi:hypothetical protein